MYKAKVYVTLREGIIDPQGIAVKNSLVSLGYDGTKSVRIGKFIELELDVDKLDVAEKIVTEMCEKLLANTITEDFRFELEEVHK